MGVTALSPSYPPFHFAHLVTASTHAILRPYAPLEVRRNNKKRTHAIYLLLFPIMSLYSLPLRARFHKTWRCRVVQHNVSMERKLLSENEDRRACNTPLPHPIATKTVQHKTSVIQDTNGQLFTESIVVLNDRLNNAKTCTSRRQTISSFTTD